VCVYVSAGQERFLETQQMVYQLSTMLERVKWFPFLDVWESHRRRQTHRQSRTL